MKISDRLIGILLAAMLFLSLFAGCAAKDETASTTRPDVTEKSISVVATIFPAYDWTRQIIGEGEDRVALTLLLDKGTDFHSYQPTVEDIYKISTCDIFIYVGGESDKWVPDALDQAENKNMVVINLLDALGDAVKTEQTLEGMEHDHEDHEDHDHEEGRDRETELDEHVWLSLRHAAVLCRVIGDALARKDPAHSAAYQANADSYIKKLNDLDAAYSDALAATSRKALLFADRFPFRYLADDYGLTCFAAFSGCSAETEASFETVNFLVGKVDELELPYVMKLEGGDSRLAETIITNSKAQNAGILELNSLQSVTARDVAEGTTYLAVMERNLETLKTALG